MKDQRAGIYWFSGRDSGRCPPLNQMNGCLLAVYYSPMKEIAGNNEEERTGRSLRGEGTPRREGKNKGQRGDAWARLTRTMDRLGAKAAASGLTAGGLEELLADES